MTCFSPPELTCDLTCCPPGSARGSSRGCARGCDGAGGVGGAGGGTGGGGTHTRRPSARHAASAWLFSAVVLATTAGPAVAADVPAWPLAGRQGVVRHVLVPVAQATDRAAYQQQIGMLCPDTQSCFLNFYTNSTGAAVALPLPEAISREATAVFRRSEKRGADSFQWRCGLQTGAEPCF